MVIIDMFGKIEKTQVSEKLKLYISNIPEDWKEDIKEKILKDIKQQNFEIKEDIAKFGSSIGIMYDLRFLQGVLNSILPEGTLEDINSIDKCVSYLVDNMIRLYFDYSDEDMSFFDWTSNCFDERFCEGDYAEKIITFLNFVYFHRPEEIYLRCIYSSNASPTVRNDIIFNCMFQVSPGFKKAKSLDDRKKLLKIIGNRLDNTLVEEADYYRIDFLINAIEKDNEYNQYHFFKTYSLLEFILLKPNQGTREIDSLLIPYFIKDFGENAGNLAEVLRQMRNKIGHGDFRAFRNKAEEFAVNYMKNFEFDYSEYSRMNWIMLHACCLLDDLLRAVLIGKFQPAFPDKS